ncbi:MAG TPA: PhoU domain-containing protein [Phycisphaerae bacterium]|nr:PhoU domain-containing protein [Phycisphaerae bacterium]
MQMFEGIDKNLRFMVVEVGKQLDKSFQVMRQPSRSLARKIYSSDNYIDTLKSYVEKKTISGFRNTPEMNRQTADRFRALVTVANNLERIADFCVNIARQMDHMDSPDVLQHYDYVPYQKIIGDALAQIPEAISISDAALALKICRAEAKTDKLYAAHISQIKGDLRKGENTDDLVACLYIFHYLERMGDALQNIGEAVLYAVTGEKLKLREHKALHAALGQKDSDMWSRAYDVDFRYETRSGTKIGKVKDRGEDEAELEAIFKNGRRDKLARERENILRWQEEMPGLPPRILEYREGKGDAALLLEYLDGMTFNEMVLNADSARLRAAQECIASTLTTAWDRTLEREPVHGDFLGQLASRLGDVWRIHPQFRRFPIRVGKLNLQSFEELLLTATDASKDLLAPFRVLIHGDFNADNIIVSNHESRIHFIDLYRSRPMDYVQDVSVFLVSNFRMPVFDPDMRARIGDVMLDFYRFAKNYACEHDDDTFDARLALGLIRSFMSSTRFELDETFAKTMYLRSAYLLEAFITHIGRPWNTFAFNDEVLRF